MNPSHNPLQRSRIRFPIAGRLVAVQLIAALIIALVVGGISYWLISRTLEASQRDQLCANVAALSSISHHFIASHSDHLQQLVNDKAIDKYVNAFNDLALLKHFESFDRYFEWISYANQHGVEEVKRQRHGEPMALKDISATPLFIESAADPDHVHLADAVNPVDREPEIRLGKYIINYFGEPLGYVSAQVPLADLHQSLGQIPVNPDVRTIVTDRRGRILHDSRAAYVGEDIHSVSPEADRLNGGDLHQAVAMRAAFLDCSDCFIAVSVVPDYGWRIFNAIRYQDFIKPFKQLCFTAAGMITVILAVIVGGIVLYVRRLVKPIGLLTLTTHQIAHSGNMDQHVVWRSGDEMGALAESFNHMLQRLRKVQKELVDERAFSENIIASMADAVIVTDSADTIVKVNQAVTDLLGYDEREILGRPLSLCIAPDQDLLLHATTTDIVREGAMRSIDSALIDRHQQRIPVSISGAMILDSAGGTAGKVFVAKDITQLKQAHARLNYLANHDSLTGLPNRLLLEDRLRQALSRIKWRDRLIAVLFLDLDRFKLVNDTLGHSAGDKLIKIVAERLRRSVREGDTVTRLGGDEFVVVLNDVAKLADVRAIAEKILASFRETVDLDGHPYTTTTSIGISISPEHGNDTETLMRHADTAMYQAKRAGRNNYQFYVSDMQTDTRSVFHLEMAMRQALENDDYRVYYQPIVDARTRRAVGVEALLRWQDIDGEMKLPAEFIPIAEETGLILPLGRWIFGHACAQVKQWQDMGYRQLSLSVNISDRQFRDPTIVEFIEETLRQTGFPADKLNFELTESILIQDIGQAKKTLAAFKSLGAKVSVDDFGTGYSSLAHLKRFPLDILKIDRSFVAGLKESKHDLAIAEAIIGLAHTLGLEVIAEGVENESQAALLRERGAEMLQGFLFSRALPAVELEQLLSAF